MYFPDLAQESQVDRGPHVRAVGWLDDKHPYARGPVPEPVRWRLARFAEQAGTSTEALNWVCFMGFHTCELCNRARNGRNFGVVAGPLVYVCPAMIAHYVEVHDYQPPEEFQRALLTCPLPATPEYQSLAAPLRFVPPEPAKLLD